MQNPTGQLNRLIPVTTKSNVGSGFGEEAAPFKHGEAREVQASVAKTHFSQLLDEVEHGREIVILRHGKPIARLVPDQDARMRRHREAWDNLKKLGDEIRARNGGLTVEEIISSIHEGHKY
ncbi:MAG TPA: type II toxin-antitoxin system prevent-host-death family antitoxin [Stellaceae bacterium]|jgi:prevent-host-death family protein|nr:type II toxin-antitoxin system prevent-host-death family antitoxin [Stellaceae bacterium]